MRATAAILAALLGLVAARATAQLAYYSDYVSFVGRDDRGRVAFALDTNRGQDGAEFQAEHFVVLHDEQSGWVELAGNGAYPNRAGDLERAPDSEYFRFAGTPNGGMTILSPVNGLTLQMQPVPMSHAREHRGNRIHMGSAAATLVWHDRRLAGRVIYEFVHFQDWNRLTRTYYGYWKDFHGIYLAVEDPRTQAWGDLYFHTQRSRKQLPLQGYVDGFALLDGELLTLEDLDVEVNGYGLAAGFYFWPLAWTGHRSASETGRELRFELVLHDRRTLGNWVIGGFAMGIVQGTVEYGGQIREAYGFGEIIK